MAVTLFFLAGCGGEKSGDGGKEASSEPLESRVETEAEFVGAEVCTQCHEEVFEDWNGSHHQLAMQVATEETVLADFDDASFTHFGDTTRFFRRDGGFFVSATGPDGKRQDFEVKYTFGVYPLQQYLIPFPGGRLQALFICWDSRSAEEGGQRWYHLYPDEAIPYTDVLHWTGQHFNWNFMCADCHSTNLHKRYDVEKGAYATAFSEINVSCEACHGPGSKHVDWVGQSGAAKGGDYGGDLGLVVLLAEAEEGEWLLDPETQNPVRSRPLESTVQVETCAPCHSHRRPIGPVHRHGGRFLDTHLPSILEEVLYHTDGQIKEEVYVYGSFVQSKMFHHGVRCSDCHNPHSLKLHAEGNALCVRCHVATKYNSKEHHFHALDSSGASCADCHMPIKHYMGVDPRRDHSIRIPRPDLSVKLGTPNACTNCHEGKDDAWAAEAFTKWWGDRERDPHFGEILAAGRRGDPGSAGPLISLAGDENLPAIVRATAIEVLRRVPSQESLGKTVNLLRDADPTVRQAALGGLEPIDEVQRLDLAGDLLSDPVRAVRIEAARVLAALPDEAFTPELRAAFERASAEFVEAQSAVADRAGSHLALGVFYWDRGDVGKAEEAYQRAMKVEPWDIPSRINLAELYYQSGRTTEGEPFLREAARLEPDRGVVHEALGQYLVRMRRYDEALGSLKRAAELMPEEARMQYFYAVALNQMGRFEESLPYLEKAVALEPANREYLMGVIAICRDHNAWDRALYFADELVRRYPGVPGFLELREQIRGGAK